MRVVRQVLAAGEEAHEGPAPPARRVADRPAQHREAGLERVEHLREARACLELDLAVDLGEVLQVRRQHHADGGHSRVCTSTESTAGRSRTIGAQLSPESAEAYTSPPVVPT